MIFDSIKAEDSQTIVSSEKVTGAKDEIDMLRKGDRIIFKLKKYVPVLPEKLWLTFSHTFFLSTGKPLFADDLELIKAKPGHFARGD